MCRLLRLREFKAGRAPATSPSASRSTPLGPPELSQRIRCPSARSSAPSLPSNARSASEGPFSNHSTHVASRSSLQL
eukprot:scaffold14948_cov60-Phaeocystis_antarctica.AAC.5